MNIFILEKDVEKSAKSLADKHINKMIIETAQILSTCIRVKHGKPVDVLNKAGRKYTRWVMDDPKEEEILLKSTHVNHPCNLWVRDNSVNYRYLCEYFSHLNYEYFYRFGKHHSYHLNYDLSDIFYNRKEWNWSVVTTTPPSVMPPECKITDTPIINYRYYYITKKSYLHGWTERNVPEWIKDQSWIERILNAKDEERRAIIIGLFEETSDF